MAIYLARRRLVCAPSNIPDLDSSNRHLYTYYYNQNMSLNIESPLAGQDVFYSKLPFSLSCLKYRIPLPEMFAII